MQENRVCERQNGIVCAYAGGDQCGIDQYLEGMAPQMRGAMKQRVRQLGQTRPEAWERRCAEGLTVGKSVVGVMGPGDGATPEDIAHAEVLGQLIAEHGWVLLTGGRPVGVMQAATHGAKSKGGLTVGILPSRTSTPENTAAELDIAIPTGLGEGRNIINVLASDIVIACGMGPGTASEVALAIKSGKRVLLLTSDVEAVAFFSKQGVAGQVARVGSPQEAISRTKTLLEEQIRRSNRAKQKGGDGQRP